MFETIFKVNADQAEWHLYLTRDDGMRLSLRKRDGYADVTVTPQELVAVGKLMIQAGERHG